MKHHRVSPRFAKAAFDLAVEMKQTEQVQKDMQLIFDTIQASRELQLLLRSPIIKASAKYASFKALFENKISELTYKFLSLILKKHRESCIEEVCFEFLKLYAQTKGVKFATLKSVVPLSADEKNQLVSFLKKKLSSEIVLKEEIDKNLIGGFVLKVDDLIFDASMLGKISSFRKHLKQKAQ